MRIVLSLLIVILSTSTYAQLVTYQAPVGSPLSNAFSVKVREKGKVYRSIPVYMASVVARSHVGDQEGGGVTSFAYFDFSGEVEVSVTFNKGKVDRAKIRPSVDNMTVSGNTISFFLSGPRNLSIEINGDIVHNLQLFANPLETSKPSVGDTSVMYFGPGIHNAGTINVSSNKTVYIAGGAIVNGDFKVINAGHVKILGRGIIYHAKGSINISFSRDVLVDGIIMLNPLHNSVSIGSSQNVTLRNLRSFSDRKWGDGIDIYCSSHVTIDGLFMRNSDDCIAIYGHRGRNYGNVKDIVVQNAVLWADVAHPILIGTHGDPPHPDTLADMTFSNLDILEQNENQIDYQGCIALNAGDANLIRNICFENIRIGDIRKGQLFNIRVMYNRKYNTAPGKGIENIYFKNVSYSGKHANLSIIAGYDEERPVRNLTFENLKINGRTISDHMPGKPGFYKTGDMADIFIGEHVSAISFVPVW